MFTLVTSDVDITVYVNDNHRCDLFAKKRMTEILLLVCVSRTPDKYYLKRQNRVESSITYRSEIIATRIVVKLLPEYCYKLRMMRFSATKLLFYM